ncbi:rhomboid-like protein [Kineosporia sp. A_224]|uniref:rhomboid-like protein n=1 Tax=Kineosporia sp. A_224 TaxID=1962180 RepID=UPI000B4AF9B4|nr:rhomboid-like protein [Kineosporia sp. A_224]
MHDAAAAAARWVRGRDVAVTYGAVVAVAAVLLQVAPDAVAQEVVLRSSTNLVNLRQHLPFALVVSAFLVPTPAQVLLVVPLVWALGAVQRRLGRGAVVLTAALGHVGATLVVSTMLLAGITHGRVALSVATAPDVGVSYVLVAALGLLTVWAPQGRRRPLVLAGSAVLGTVLAVDRAFTDLGHLAAWLLGLALASFVGRAARAARETPAA